MTIGNEHSVELRLEQDADGVWLVCTDDGIGMTRAIIENHFLVSGASRRRDILKLERDCQTHGFSSGRTGQFGIGALSYFMLADRVIIHTRRSQEANDHERNGWVFVTDGVGNFGELRAVPSADLRPGTTVRLRLRHDVPAQEAVWASELASYLKKLLEPIPKPL